MTGNEDDARATDGAWAAGGSGWEEHPIPVYGEPGAATAPGGWAAPVGDAGGADGSGAGAETAAMPGTGPAGSRGRSDRNGVATAALVAGALVAGAAAGFGGAWFVRGQEVAELGDRNESLASELSDTQDGLSEVEEAGRASLTAFDGYDLCGLQGYGDASVNSWHVNGESSNLGFGCRYADGVFVSMGWWDVRMVSGQMGGEEAPISDNGYLYVDDRGRTSGDFGSLYVFVDGPESTAKPMAERVRQELEDSRV